MGLPNFYLLCATLTFKACLARPVVVVVVEWS